MTDEERAEAIALAPEFYGDEGEELFVRGYGAACDAHRARLDRQIAINTEDESEVWRLRSRLIELETENEQLRLDAQKLYADYMDRGAAMRETGDMVRSLYAPKNERLNKENGKLRVAIKELSFAAELAHGEFVLRVNKGLSDWHVDNVIDILSDALNGCKGLVK